jgi:hypothetical protein
MYRFSANGGIVPLTISFTGVTPGSLSHLRPLLLKTGIVDVKKKIRLEIELKTERG